MCEQITNAEQTLCVTQRTHDVEVGATVTLRATLGTEDGARVRGRRNLTQVTSKGSKRLKAT